VLPSGHMWLGTEIFICFIAVQFLTNFESFFHSVIVSSLGSVSVHFRMAVSISIVDCLGRLVSEMIRVCGVGRQTIIITYLS